MTMNELKKLLKGFRNFEASYSKLYHKDLEATEEILIFKDKTSPKHTYKMIKFNYLNGVLSITGDLGYSTFLFSEEYIFELIDEYKFLDYNCNKLKALDRNLKYETIDTEELKNNVLNGLNDKIFEINTDYYSIDELLDSISCINDERDYIEIFSNDKKVKSVDSETYWNYVFDWLNNSKYSGNEYCYLHLILLNRALRKLQKNNETCDKCAYTVICGDSISNIRCENFSKYHPIKIGKR